MKLLFGSIFLFILFTGCTHNDTQQRVSLMGEKSSASSFKSTEQQQERQNKLELSKIEASTKIELEKIKSQNQLQIAKLNATTQTQIAQTDSQTKIQTSQLDAKTKQESMQYMVYIVIAVIIVILVALILLYLNSKKNRELQRKLQEEKLKHERILKEKELEEQRLHKVLELVAEGKLPQNIQEEVILSISKSNAKTIKHS